MLVCSHLPGETTRYILPDKDELPPLLGFNPEVNPYLVASGKSVAQENQTAYQKIYIQASNISVSIPGRFLNTSVFFFFFFFWGGLIINESAWGQPWKWTGYRILSRYSGRAPVQVPT